MEERLQFFFPELPMRKQELMIKRLRLFLDSSGLAFLRALPRTPTGTEQLLAALEVRPESRFFILFYFNFKICLDGFWGARCAVCILIYSFLFFV